VTATGCGIAPPAGLAADFYYQATDPATNAPIPGYKNVPVDIGPGQPKSFLVALTPQAPFAAQDVRLRFNCANAPDAAVYSGLNTLLLSSSSTPGPDVVALAATVNGNGIVDVPGPTGTGFFAVASVNVGTSATITASANTGGSALPVGLFICQTNPATGSCLAPPSASVTTTIDAGATPTFAVFAASSNYIAFHPAGNRIFVVFRDAGGAVKGATSVAVRTLGAPAANVAPVANAGGAQSTYLGVLVQLDGSGSSDANGDALTYAWSVVSYPGFFAPALSGANTASPTFTPRDAGSYAFSLVVSDGRLSSAPSTVAITVANSAGPTPAGSGLIVQNVTNFWTIDEDTMTKKVDFTCGNAFQAIDLRSDNVVVGVTSTQFFEVNPVSGICSARGATPEWLRGLTVSVKGQAYGVSFNQYQRPDGSGVAHRLYKLSNSGASQSFVYLSGASNYVTAIDFGPDGKLFGLGIVSGGSWAFVIIDPDTGSNTVAFSLPVAPTLGDFDIDSSGILRTVIDGTLYKFNSVSGELVSTTVIPGFPAANSFAPIVYVP
jgi:hypothetical protein